MPILGPRATTNPLIAPADWQDKLPRVENRPPSIVTPSRPTWELYLTGGEGYVGRDGIQSGGIYGHDGQPYIQTQDMVFETHDLIHWHELRNIHQLFEDKKVGDEVSIAQRTLTIVNKSDIYLQGCFEDGTTCTIFHTCRTFLVGLGTPEADLREVYVGMQRVADFFMLTTF